MTSETTPIILTPAELELIRIKREEERLAQEKAEMERLSRHEREVLDKKESIKKEIASGQAQVAAAKEFAKKMPKDLFKLVETVSERVAEIRRYENGSSVVAWSEKYLVPDAHFESLDRKDIKWTADGGVSSNSYPRWTVNVRMHRPYRGSSHYDFRRKNNGYKMFLVGDKIEYAYEKKALVNFKTIAEKINEIKSTEKAQEEAKNRKMNNTQRVYAELSLRHPEAKIEIKEEYRTYNGPYEVIKITHTNGTVVTVEAGDKSFSFIKIEFPYDKDNHKFMDELSELKIVRNQQ